MCHNVGTETTPIGELFTRYGEHHRTDCDEARSRCRTTFERPDDLCQLELVYRVADDGSLDAASLECDYLC